MIEPSPCLKARIAGLLYLIVIAGGIFAELFVRGRLVVHGDAAATAHNILAHQMLFRLGFAIEIFYCAFCNVPITLIFYGLFKVVNKNAALLVVFFSLIGTTIESVSMMGHFAPLILLGNAPYLAAFTPQQLQAASYVSLRLFENGFAIALVFFSLYCVALGYLILRSTFFPRFIGVLLAIEGVCYMTNSFANFIAPEFAARVFPILMASGLAEMFLCLWLLVAGLNVSRWREQAGASAV